MCRVNGIGSNAGAGTPPINELRLQGAEGGLCDSVTRRLLPAITITTTNVHARKDLPPPRRRPRAGARGISTGLLTHAVLTPALADAIWHVARAPAVEKLVDEHRPTFILWILAGLLYPVLPVPLRPLAIPSPSSLISLLPFVLLSPSPPSLPSHLHLLSSPHLLFLLTTPYSFFSAIRRNAAPTYVPSEEDVLRACAKSTAIIETRFWMGGLI
ncbi:hypothetical protein B0H14DRAFT_3467486 [Mycena olivaceomarginata]|nr:hypothetical protein B0H14DRAFT_3467486 [Mycena olivaceomarginata]